MRSPLSLAVDTLAVYRITKLIVSDEITASTRERVIAHLGDPEDNKISYLVTCPHCVSMWAALGVSVARMMAPDSKLLSHLLEALAVSAVTGIVAEREDSF